MITDEKETETTAFCETRYVNIGFDELEEILNDYYKHYLKTTNEQIDIDAHWEKRDSDFSTKHYLKLGIRHSITEKEAAKLVKLSQKGKLKDRYDKKVCIKQ